MKIQSYLLGNKLSVIAIDTKAFPSVSVVLFIGTGSRYENKNNNGIAHFFEHMAFKGSKNYPDAMKLASTVEGFGGEFNAFTGKEYTGYLVKGPRDHFSTMADVLADMVQNPLLKETEIQKEKGVIIEEINMYEDNPSHKIAELYEGMLYQPSPLGYDTLGTKETVQGFNRDKIFDYINTYYYPNNAVLVVAGGLDTKMQMTEIVENKFGSWNQGKTKVLTKLAENQHKPNFLVHYKKTEQSHFVLGYRAFSYFDERKYILSVLASVLGGGMSSRLFHEVREQRGLCYYISTEKYFYKDVGGICTRAGVRNDIKSVVEAIKVILAQHNDITVGKITNTEVKKAKEFIKGRLIMSLEDSFNIAYVFGRKKILENSLESIEKTIESIDKVDLNQVVKLAGDIFVQNNLNIALIGPYEENSLSSVLE